MFLSLLGRQSDISLAELEAVFGKSSVTHVAPHAAIITADSVDISLLGGSTKIGRIIHTIASPSDSDKTALVAASKIAIDQYIKKWRQAEHKITLGISAYNLNVSPRDVQKTGLLIKSSLKKHGVSLRLIPNTEPELSTATSHNNKLGLSDSKVELMILKTNRKIILAESIGAQNITAYAKRDHGKPKRDAFVGMLPPKLAQIMLNLALGDTPQSSNRPTESPEQSAARDSTGAYPIETRREAVLDDFGGESATLTILDPFCGTGTVLQEALLRGFDVVGSDLSDKMIDYTQQNLTWLASTHHADGSVIDIRQADATNHTWNHAKNISAVVCETYLGQPFSAPPSPPKLKEVVGNCNHIISAFLKNIHPQLQPGTHLCIAVPVWRDKEGRLTHLPLTRNLSDLDYTLNREPLVYSRPDQVVAREILVLTKS